MRRSSKMQILPLYHLAVSRKMVDNQGWQQSECVKRHFSTIFEGLLGVTSTIKLRPFWHSWEDQRSLSSFEKSHQKRPESNHENKGVNQQGFNTFDLSPATVSVYV